MGIKIILADDHDIILDGIKAIIEREAKKNIEIVGAVSNGEKFLELAKTNPADVYILDISMPTMDGIEATKRLREIDPKSKIIILSMHDDRTLVEKAFKYGVKGYLLKENATEEIITAIDEVYNNRFYLSSKISKYIVEGFLGRPPQSSKDKNTVHLTQREKEVLELMTEGLNSKDIANQLDLSLATVYKHINNIMKKLDIHSQAGLICYALKEGTSHL